MGMNAKNRVPYGTRNIYLNEWRRIMMNERKKVQEKHMRKIQHLCRKWSKDETCVQTFRGVTVSDQELREQDFKKGPRIYGRVEVSAEERAVIDLPPNFSMYQKVDVNRT